MNSDITDFVMNHPLFSHHDHHIHLKDFEQNRLQYNMSSMFGYAYSDIETAVGTKDPEQLTGKERYRKYWPYVSTTGYGQAVTQGCRTLFDMDYSLDNFQAITEKLQSLFVDKTASEVFDYFLKEVANIKWVVEDAQYVPGDPALMKDDMFPDYYRCAWRMDSLFSIFDASPIESLEQLTGISVLSLNHLVEAMNANIDQSKETGNLAALKLGIAYFRDLNITDPTFHEAELAFNRIRNRRSFYEGQQQHSAAVNTSESRSLSDYLLHRLLERAHDEDIPVQIHTGYLAGNWYSLEGTRAMKLIPIFDKYRQVRFDVFHASWPWTSEMGTIAKNYPNVYPDMCWMWAMNPSESERTLAEWLDGVPYNKIFAFGADTGFPWGDVGYAIQARKGIAWVLEEKVRRGFYSKETAKEVASAIMLTNGEQFHRLGMGDGGQTGVFV